MDDHPFNHAPQLFSEDEVTDNNDELLNLEWSNNATNKMQTEAFDEKDKRKARGSLRTPSGNKGSFMASPKKKKPRQVKVDSTEAVETMVIDVDLQKDIDKTQQVSASTIDVPEQIIAIDEDKEDKVDAAGEEEDTDSKKAVAKGLPEAILNKKAETSPQLEDPPSILKTSKKKSMLEVATGGNHRRN